MPKPKKTFIASFGVMLAGVVFLALTAAANADVVASPIVVVSPVSPAVPMCPVFSRSLSVGVTGSDVTMLQGYLHAQGYLSVSATGYFGSLTQAAVARWQAQGGVVSLADYGSGIFGPLSRAYFSRSCGAAGGGSGSGSSGGSGSTSSSTTQASVSFSASPSSGIAPLTVQFTATAPQGSAIGNSVSFGDGMSGTLGFVPVCSNCNARATVSHTYTAIGAYTAELTSGACACPANGVCNCPAMIILATAAVTVDAAPPVGGTGSSTSIIASSTVSGDQQLNAPGSVTLAPNGIAEIRNASFYFTLANIAAQTQSASTMPATAASTATIDITPVGCWNSFPSDPTPAIRCMIAVVPTPPQTLWVGQAYTFGSHTITLTSVSILDNTATFGVQ